MALELGKILDNPYASKLNSLTNLVDLASTSGEMFLVAPENLRKEVYIFDTRGDEEITLESDITDNWVEDNSTMQDHIGLKPMTITLSGYVGELTNSPQNAPEQVNKPITPITQTTAFLAPKLTTQAQYILNRVTEVYDIYQKANQETGRFEDKMGGIQVPAEASRQQQAFGKFYEMWETRQLSTIYTPFGAYNSMAIMSINATQSEDSAYIMQFSVTFKQVRIADTIYTKKSKKKFAGRTAQTLSEEVDKGVKKNTSLAMKGVQAVQNLVQKKD